MFTSLSTSRLLIRRFSPADAVSFSHYRSLPSVSRFQSAYSLERAQALIVEMAGSDPSVKGRWFQFALQLHGSSPIIGDIGFNNTDSSGRSWIGYTLNPDYAGFGYAREAVTAVLDYYASLGITDVWANTDPDNSSSMKLLDAVGFKLVESSAKERIYRRR